MNHITQLEFSDEELNILNDLVRQHKVTISNEDLVLLMMGKKSTPIVSLTVKIGQAFEKRVDELKEEQQAATAAPVSAE